MILIVGLGNPGQKYEKTRHNIGFLAIKAFAGKNNFPDFIISQKTNSEISEGILNGEKIILAKPQTYMNKSGKTINSLVKRYCINKAMAELTQYIWVIHDDVDLPLGEMKIVKNRGAAGHKGVESIIKELKTKDFVRFRVGIKPQKIENRKQKVETFVLQKFNKEEEKIIKEVIKKIVEAIEMTLKEGLEKAMNKYNK